MIHINRVLMLFCVFQITHLHPMDPSSSSVFIPIESGKMGQNQNIEVATEKIPLVRAQDHLRQVDLKIPLTCEEKVGCGCTAVMAICSGLSAVGALTSGIVAAVDPSAQWAHPFLKVSSGVCFFSSLCCYICCIGQEKEYRHRRGRYSPPPRSSPYWYWD